MPRKIKKLTRWNQTQAAREFGVTRQEMRDAIGDAQHRKAIEITKDGKQTVREFYVAVSGDIRAERLKKIAAERKLAELKVSERERNLISLEESVKYILDTYSPIREMAVALPGQLSALVNPSDPAHARAHLDTWVDDFLKAAKAKVPLPPEITT